MTLKDKRVNQWDKIPIIFLNKDKKTNNHWRVGGNIKIKTKKYFKINFEIFFKLKGIEGHPQDKHFCCVPCTTCKIFYKKFKKFLT